MPHPPSSLLFPYTTLLRSIGTIGMVVKRIHDVNGAMARPSVLKLSTSTMATPPLPWTKPRPEEHTSELQSRRDIVCRLLLAKQNKLRLDHASGYPQPHS